MKEINKDGEMRQEYDFSSGVRGKHFRAYQEGTNVIFLEPDVADVFKDSGSVNHALRLLLNLACQEVKKNIKTGSSGHL
ncbi:MAG: hypothetical protein AAFP10_04115 [Pseudomonadota bacterium]